MNDSHLNLPDRIHRNSRTIIISPDELSRQFDETFESFFKFDMESVLETSRRLMKSLKNPDLVPISIL